MPEGDTLHRLAARLQPLVGARIVAGESREQGPLEVAENGRITAIAARGKNLLVTLDNGWSARVHLGIAGSCEVYPAAAPWRRSSSRATFVLRTEDHAVVFFDAPRARLVRTAHLRAMASLVRLGPDLLAPSLDLDAVIARARAPGNASRAIAEVLLDQRIAAGIGNVYKCELLFIQGLDPWRSLQSLDDEALRALFRLARELLQKNLATPRRITRFSPGPDSWVYGRGGRPCLRCGERVRVARQGEEARPTYHCPRCQPRHRPGAE